ncbi:MAG: hydantoinase/carbamoylase family amidase [Vicinamibacterales bacterium]
MMGRNVRESGALAGASKLARALFSTLARQTADPPGVTRISYGPGERRAFEIVAAAARDWNAEVVFDAAGNQFITLPGRDRARTIYVGSHLDSVPHGGNYDGAAGVVMGMAAQSMLAADEDPPFCDLTVACLRAEESCWFPHSYIGSQAAVGRLDPAVLDAVRRSDTGRSLAEHMREEGFDPDAVRRGRSLITPERALAYIEPHIEQGPVLIAEELPVAIVTGIRGSVRYREARCIGEYAHSGATPRRLRRDAVVAAAGFVNAAQDLWDRMERDGHDVVLTFGIVETDLAQHSFSKVSGGVHLCVDVRSQSVATLQEARIELAGLAAGIASRHGVQIDLGPMSGSEPASMSPRLVSIFQTACGGIDTRPYLMASGAGHDAATFAHAGIPSVMIFIRNSNGSHNPDESMEMADFDRALQLLVAALKAPAKQWSAG